MEQILLEAAKELPSLVVLMLGVSHFLNYMKEEKKLFMAAMERNTKALIKFTVALRTLALMVGREDLIAETDDAEEDKPVRRKERPSSIVRRRRRHPTPPAPTEPDEESPEETDEEETEE